MCVTAHDFFRDNAMWGVLVGGGWVGDVQYFVSQKPGENNWSSLSRNLADDLNKTCNRPPPLPLLRPPKWLADAVTCVSYIIHHGLGFRVYGLGFRD